MSDFHVGTSYSHIIIKMCDVMGFTKIKLLASWAHSGLISFVKGVTNVRFILMQTWNGR